MPSTVANLLDRSGLELFGIVPWGILPKARNSGIYIVSLSPSEHENRGTFDNAPISIERIEYWLARVPTIELDGIVGPDVRQVAERLSEFWLPDESIVYIGMTERPLRNRIRQYYSTDLGDRKPHAGGHWIKTLSNLSKAFVYFAECHSPDQMESRLIQLFIDGVSSSTRSNLRDPLHPFPFANLEYPKGRIKIHCIGKSKLS